MNKILKIMEKNFKNLVRARKSAIIVFLAPLFLVALLGLAFSNTTSFNLRVGVHSGSYSELSENLLQKLSDNQITVVREETEDSCILELKSGKNQLCMVMPTDMQIQPNVTNDILFYVDPSKVSLIYVVLDIIGEKVNEQETEISQDLTSDLLDKLSYTQTRISESRPLLQNIQNNNKLIIQKNQLLQSSFDNMDLGFDKGNFGVAQLSTKMMEYDKHGRITSLKTHGLKAIKEAKELLDKAGLTAAEETEIGESLDEIEDDIEQAYNLSLIDQAAYKSEITGLIGNLNIKLDDTKSLIDGVSSFRDDMKSNFGDITAKLDETQTYIDSLSTAFDEINAKISGIAITDAGQIANPINTVIKPVSTGGSHFSNVLPTLLVLLIVITGILLSSTMVMEEKKGKAFVRNYLTPTSNLTFNVATFLTALLLLALQIIMFFIIAVFSFNITITTLFGTLFAVLLIVSVFVLIGMLIGNLFQSPETNTLASILTAAFLLFFSNTVLPLESMPIWMIAVAKFNPFVVGETLLKQTMLFTGANSAVYSNLLLLIIYFVVLFFGLLLLQDYFGKIAFFHRQHSTVKKKGKFKLF